MINKISFKNYKIFKDKQEVELKPITIVIGKNNSGKSAIVRLPLLIEAAFKTKMQSALAINNGGVSFGLDLRDLVYGKATRAMEFDLETINSKLNIGVYVSDDMAKIEHWNYNSEIEIQEETKDRYKVLKGIANNLSFEGFKLVTENKVQCDEITKDFLFETDYIGPIRVIPSPDYRIDPSASDKSGVQGENLYQKLLVDAKTTEQTIIKKVSAWYEKSFEGWGVRVNQDKDPVFQVEIHRDNLKQNIKEAGIGIGQVLPIVTRAMIRCDKPTLIMIEEPETHLHPGAHGDLAELFVESTKDDANKNYLIETHSLNFILRLRRLIAEKKISKDKVKIYYVDFLEDENCSIVNDIIIDDKGNVKDWPDNIFNETLYETIAIRTAQLDN